MDKEKFDVANFVKTNDSIVCVKDTLGHVLFQNLHCLELCGDMTQDSSPCEKNCMTRYVRDTEVPAREEGTQYFPSQQIENQFYDIFFINDKKFLTTILYPLNKRMTAELQYYTHFQLTAREQEIVGLILKKKTNKEISESLHISLGTLKTHLNNIYKKIPESACKKLRDNYNTNN